MKEQKYFGTVLLVVFFTGASIAWKASWNSARMTPLLIQHVDGATFAAVPKVGAATHFAIPKTKKQQAPAWGSFRVAGVPSAPIPISLKPDLKKLADKKAENQTKKKEVAKKPAAAPVKVVATVSKPQIKNGSITSSAMKAISDANVTTHTVIETIPNVQNPQDPTKKNSKTRSAKDWEFYITENTSTVKARVQEFISAYQTGQLVSEDQIGNTPDWAYGLIQALFDHNELVVQDGALRIAQEIHTAESFALLVHNSERVDHSLRPILKQRYESFQAMERVRSLGRALFNNDQQVQMTALNVIRTSMQNNLISQNTQTAPEQRAQASTLDPQEVFQFFLQPLERLASSDRDRDVIDRAEALARDLRASLGSTLSASNTTESQSPN